MSAFGRSDECYEPPFRSMELLETLRAQLAEARAVLKDLEWGVFTSHLSCPVCHNGKHLGHAPDCQLAKAIGVGSGA